MHHAIAFSTLGLLTLGLAACGEPAEPQRETPGYTDDELLALYQGIERMGLDSSDLAFDGSDVVVEGDMLVDAERAIALGQLASEADDGSVEKGYYWRVTPVDVGRTQTQIQRAAVPSGSIGMSFDSDVPDDWKEAMLYAAGKWNTNPCINISEGGSTLRVQMSSTMAGNEFARGALPDVLTSRGRITGVKPGDQIRINANLSSSTAEKRAIAMHELGHVLGFKHPNAGTHIDSTDSGTSYSTIMRSSLNVLSDLSSDDKKTRDIVFKQVTETSRAGRRQVCQTGLVDL